MKTTLVFVISVLLLAATATGISWYLDVGGFAAQQKVSKAIDADVPNFLKKAKMPFSKEEFLTSRQEGIALKRGFVKGKPFDTSLRPKAIEKMEEQEREFARNAKNTPADTLFLAAWNPIGPAPIPNGQTSPTAPVSGRVISIAVHPTNANIVYVGTAQGGLYRSTNGGTNWTPIMDSAQSLAIGAIAIAPSSPETVYVGTGEPNASLDSYYGVGLYRIDNASTTATLSGPLGVANFNGRSISEIIVHPTNPATIFVSSSSGLGGIRSTSPPGTPATGVFRSTNATAAAPTFQGIGFSANVRDMAIDPTDPNILVINYIAGGGGLFRVPDALAATPSTPTQVLTLACTNTGNCNAELASQRSGGAANATFYAGAGQGNGQVWTSTDGGATWGMQIDNNFCGGQCFYDIAIAVDPTNPANVYLGGDPTLIFGASSNSGTSFSNITAGLHVDTHAIAVAPSSPSTIYLGTDGGIYKSTNSGASFTQLNNSQFSATQFMSIDVHPTDPNFTIGGTQDNGTNWYQPGATWNRVDFGDGGYAQIDQNAPDTTNVRMYHTYFNNNTLQGYGTVSNTGLASDGNWSFRGCSGGAAGNGITCNPAVNFYAPLERGPGNPNTIYYGTDRLYRSSDSGSNHTVVSQAPITGSPISSIGISPQNDNVRIVGLNDGTIAGTTTGSAALVDFDPGGTIPNSPINRSIIDPNNQNTAYVTLSAFGINNVFKTTNLNGGPPTWTAVSTGIPQVPVSSIVVDPMDSNKVYVGTDIGVYASTDAGATWAPFGTGLPRVAVFGMSITAAPRKLRIATHGKGMYEISLGGGGGAGIPGTGVGPIPDGGPGCGPLGAPLNISFDASAVSGSLTNVSVDMTASHSWVGDVHATLIAPDATQHVLFASTGSTTAAGCGDNSDLGNTYAFNDAAGGDWWAEATNGTSAYVMAAGNYRTSTAGDVPGGGAATNLNAAFASANPTGTWTLRIEDGGAGDTGSVSAANLFLTTGGPPTNDAAFDYDGDSKTDLSIFRPGPGQWWIQNSQALTTFVTTFGVSTDILVPEDFTGDGKDDIAFFRPASGEWFVLRSEDNSFFSFPFGANGDIPAPGDYDGDGKADPAVFRPASATWFILNSGGGVTTQAFGLNGDQPIPQDYDGDGKDDIAIFRPSVSEWFYQRSSDLGVLGFAFGTAGDRALPSDFTGDGKADIAFFRPSAGQWFVLRSEDTTFFAFPFGTATDIPAPGDYDGDGKTDAAVFRPSSATWFINGTTSGIQIQAFGATGDIPTPNSYVR